MCNRYSSTKNEARLRLAQTAFAIALAARFNIAPQNRVPVAVLESGILSAREMRWGMHGFGKHLVTNGKSETARYKTLFRNAWGLRRCIIPADGFYEWKTEGRVKLPYRFILKEESLFWFAGLWNEETTKSGQETFGPENAESEERFVILTREANSDMRIHNRMPLILTEQEIEPWLSSETSREWVPNGIPEGALRSYRVGSAVSKPGWETPECIAPLVGALEQAELW